MAAPGIVLLNTRFAGSLQDKVDASIAELGLELRIWDPETATSDSKDFETGSEDAGRVCGILVYGHPTIDGKLLSRFPQCKVVSNFGTGCDHIRVKEAKAAGVMVGNVPGVMADATADLAMALLLSVARNVVPGDAISRSPSTSQFDFNWFGTDVSYTNIGIVGFGQIGKKVAKRALGFSMKVLYYSRSRADAATEASLEATYCPTLADMLPQVDFLVLCCPATAETHHMVNTEQFRLMKKSAILINIGRGKLVNHDALYTALATGQIRACGTDVTDPEPLPRDHPLLTLHNLVITPHVGSATLRTRELMLQVFLDNLTAGLQGRPLPCLHPDCH